jgi:hypothetical protein
LGDQATRKKPGQKQAGQKGTPGGKKMIPRADLEKLLVDLTERGLLIEAGFVSLRLAALDPTAPDIQITEMRMAFFAGAQHLFTSIMSILEPGSEEPTEKDMLRMDLIHRELDKFGRDFELRHLPSKGSS